MTFEWEVVVARVFVYIWLIYFFIWDSPPESELSTLRNSNRIWISIQTPKRHNLFGDRLLNVMFNCSSISFSSDAPHLAHYYVNNSKIMTLQRLVNVKYGNGNGNGIQLRIRPSFLSHSFFYFCCPSFLTPPASHSNTHTCKKRKNIPEKNKEEEMKSLAYESPQKGTQ